METPIKTIVTMYMLYPSLLPVRRAAAAIGRSWRVGVYVAPHALAIATAALRRRIPPHMLIGTCQAAQPLFGCRAARSRCFTPSTLTSA